MDIKEQAKWSPAELEYTLINDAIRNRLNMNLTTSVYLVARDPLGFSKRSDVLIDFWDLIAPYYKGDKRRDELDARIAKLQRANTAIVDSLLELAANNEREISSSLRKELDAFFFEEHTLYREVLDLRHERGLDIGMKREWTERERSKTIKSIASENFSDSGD